MSRGLVHAPSASRNCCRSLCNRSIWLNAGTVAWDGNVDEGIRGYLSQSLKATGVSSGQPVKLGESLELRSFELSPNPVESGARLTFSLEFGASQPARISELALLIYSSKEVRVAIVDLRSSGLPVLIPAGGAWTIGGSITSLPLVEGDYRLGLYVGCGDFIGSPLDLVDLAVAARATSGGYVPYPAAHRGVVELEARVSHEGRRLT